MTPWVPGMHQAPGSSTLSAHHAHQAMWTGIGTSKTGIVTGPKASRPTTMLHTWTMSPARSKAAMARGRKGGRWPVAMASKTSTCAADRPWHGCRARSACATSAKVRLPSRLFPRTRRSHRPLDKRTNGLPLGRNGPLEALSGFIDEVPSALRKRDGLANHRFRVGRFQHAIALPCAHHQRKWCFWCC